MTVETLGIDIAKNVFQLHKGNNHGCVALKRRVMRDQLLDIVAQVARCTIEDTRGIPETDCIGSCKGHRQIEANGDRMYMPELLRVKGAMLLAQARHNREEAESHLVQSDRPKLMSASLRKRPNCVNRLANLTPYRRPILTPSRGVV